ncbi:MAG: protein kinase [Deltaproteobacteria bacterium]|nr:protein kinase [Deltaproteobacteria bacterium]
MNCRNCGQPLDDIGRFCKFCGSSVPPDPDEAAAPIKVGDLLQGKWRIDKRIGQGGMGSVYLAHDVSLDRKVAIKILAPDLCNDAEFVARFEREAKATANLEHPNVVLVYAVGEHFGRPFIVMKYLEGQSLARYLKKNPDGLPPDEVLEIFQQLCSGLGFIHQKGFIHRDIKSANVHIGPDGKATILDFGILRDVRSQQSLTRVGVVMGTPHYIAPEQALGRPIDHRVDLYALGVLLYECLTGTPPYDADSAKQLIEMHLKASPPDPCCLVPDLPLPAGEVVRKAIAKKADERFQSAEEMAAALEASLAPVGHRDESPEEEQRPADEEETAAQEEEVERDTKPNPTAQPSSTAALPAPLEKPPQRRSSLGTWLALLVVIAAAGAGYYSLRHEPPAQVGEQEGPPGAATPLARPPKPPASPATATPQAQAKALLTEGLDYAKSRHYDYALQKFLLAEKLEPGNATLLYSAGLAYYAVKEYGNAVLYFGRALEAEPTHTEARLCLARSYAAQGATREALGELQGLIRAGYRNLDALESDEALKGLRQDPGWNVIRQSLGAAPAPPLHARPAKPDMPRASESSPDVTVMGLTGELIVQVEPSGATVTIDNKPRGRTPLRVELNAGPHKVMVEMPGYQRRIFRDVKVPLARSVTLKETLEKVR